MRFLHRLVISLAVSLVGHLGLNHSPDWVFLVLSSKLNVFGQPCNFSFEPRNLSFGLSEVLLHLIYWSAHNCSQLCCCLGTSTMIPGEPRKTSSRSLVDVGIQPDLIRMPGNLEIFLSESPYPSNSLQLR